MNKIKPKHQRLLLVSFALISIIAAGLLGSWALRNQANYFFLPEQMMENPPVPGQAVRLGGMVAEGTIERLPDGISVMFIVTDNVAARIPVKFSGILPDLFVENSGVVAEGSLDEQGLFIATNLLAKHDENYIPRELEEIIDHQGRFPQNTVVGN
jgi:cytochrome c-type biogenesis protein CcmE